MLQKYSVLTRLDCWWYGR